MRTILVAADQHLVDVTPVVDDEPSDLHPSRESLGSILVTVDAHEVELGDVIFGLASPIDRIESDGRWWLYGSLGTIVARRLCGSRVQIVRGVPVEVAEPTDPVIPASTGTSSDGWD